MLSLPLRFLRCFARVSAWARLQGPLAGAGCRGACEGRTVRCRPVRNHSLSNPLMIQRPAAPGQTRTTPTRRETRAAHCRRAVLSMGDPGSTGRWSGRLYNVDNGNSYATCLLELGPTTIRVEGCAIGICGGQNMNRIESPAIRTGSTTSLRRGTVRARPRIPQIGVGFIAAFSAAPAALQCRLQSSSPHPSSSDSPRRAYPVRFRSKTYATAKLLTSRTM